MQTSKISVQLLSRHAATSLFLIWSIVEKMQKYSWINPQFNNKILLLKYAIINTKLKNIQTLDSNLSAFKQELLGVIISQSLERINPQKLHVPNNHTTNKHDNAS